MSESSYARFGFGVATLLFGVISIKWGDSDLWRHALLIGGSFAAAFAWGCAVVLCAGGLMVSIGRGASGPVLLAAGGLFLTVSCIADIAAAPASFSSYIDAFELFAIVCGAGAVMAQITAGSQRSALLARGTRIGFGFCNISYAAAQLVFFSYTASLIPRWIPAAPLWTALTTLAFALAAIAMLIARQAPLALRLVATMLTLFAVLVWVPRLAAKPSLENWSEFMLTLVIAGAAWTVGTVQTPPANRRSSQSIGTTK